GTLQASYAILMHQGTVTDTSNAVQSLVFSEDTFQNAPAGGTAVGDLIHPAVSGDLDGDGFFDSVVYYPVHETPTEPDPATDSSYQLGISLSDGVSLGSVGPGSLLFTNTLTSLSPFISSVSPIYTPDDFGWALVDANGDGLADLVRNHMPRVAGGGGGQLLLN